MQVINGAVGAILLFLGRELNFFFAGAMAFLIGFRLTPLLPGQWPGWYDYVFMAILGVIAALLVISNERIGYFVSGFLAGGYALIQYYAPGVLTVPLLLFLIGGIIGAVIIGLLTEWALMIVSCLFGAYYLTTLFPLSSTAQILVGSGLFIIGALTQVILMRMQRAG